MPWYYADGEKPVGPLEESDIKHLADSGTILQDTLVWHTGLPDWKRYDELFPKITENDSLQVDSVCSECGKSIPQQEMLHYEDRWICAECKPIFIQKLKEGVPLQGSFQYAGFRIRFAAKFIDGIILWIIYFSLGMVGELFQKDSIEIFLFIIQILTDTVYSTWMVGKYGATLGKMACKLKIIHADGSKIEYGWALGRHFAEWISGIILGIGYLMAAFDIEKRSLHDRICGTRVIHKL